MGLNREEQSVLQKMRGRTNAAGIEFAKNKAKQDSSAEYNEKRKILEPICNEFFETEEYKSGDKMISGYTTCCEIYSFCGTSGWVIFLIIVLVLGVLAGGAAAFWFFYWKRKYGGKEETVEENTESTENSKTVIEIPVGTY